MSLPPPRDTPTPCSLNYRPFDVIANHDRREATVRGIIAVAVRDIEAMCSTCPIWRDCIPQNRNEPWVKALLDARKERTDKDLRVMHAAYVRLLKAGVQKSQMLPEIVEGEAAYQARSYERRLGEKVAS